MPTTITLTLPNLPAHLFCQLLCYASPSLLDHFPCSSPYLIVMHTAITEALLLSPSLSFALSVSSELLFFASLSLEVDWRKRECESEREKRNQRKCLRRPDLYLAKHLHGSMTPRNSPSCSTALEKDRVQRRGRTRKSVKGGERDEGNYEGTGVEASKHHMVKSLSVLNVCFISAQDFLTSTPCLVFSTQITNASMRKRLNGFFFNQH